MKYLETILNFLVTLARVIFPRKKRKQEISCPATDPRPLPDGDNPPLPPDPGNGGDTDSHRSDPDPDLQGHPAPLNLQPTDIAGCFLMLAGGAGCLYKWFAL